MVAKVSLMHGFKETGKTKKPVGQKDSIQSVCEGPSPGKASDKRVIILQIWNNSGIKTWWVPTWSSACGTFGHPVATGVEFHVIWVAY